MTATLVAVFIGAPAGDGARPGVTVPSAADLLARSQAAYKNLTSYSDSGTVVVQTSGTAFEYSSFITRYRRPTNFYFDYRLIEATDRGGTLPLNRRTIIWMLNGNMEKWVEYAKHHESFAAGSPYQISALSNMAAGTKGASVLIPSLIFGKSGLASTVHEAVSMTEAGIESVGGRRAYKLTGYAQSTYPSGKTFNVRPLTLWLDAETYLIRKMLEDTPKSYARGSMHRITITFNPVLNPRLGDDKFTYKVPDP